MTLARVAAILAAVALAAADGARAAPLVPLAQSFFLCEGHGQLTANPYFQNNLLNFLLSP